MCFRSVEQNDREYFTIENRPLPPGQELVADLRRISPKYLSTMGIALLRGRTALRIAMCATRRR
jgi:hypothetical protein